MERHKRSRAALSRLPASVADVGANIVLQPQELKYVTALLSLVHRFNRPFRKNGIRVLGVKKPVLLAGFIPSDLDAGHLSDRCILASVIRTILFLAGSGPAVPNPGQVTSVYDGLRTRIYTEQISASLQFGRRLDSCVFGQPSAYEHFCGKN
jgi:hypothetical protein